ncbi:MAG: toll/interleukin-1 receptor domain-containing protein [Phycisphaerales bacterium]
MNAPSPDVFISYAHQDFPLAESLCLGLEARGIRCAIAPRDIPPGEAYGAWIARTIAGVRVVVLMLSSSSNASSMVMRELERAASLAKPLIPVRLEDIAPSGEMAFFVGREHRLDALSRPIDRHADKLAEAVRRFVDGESTAAPQADGRMAGPVRSDAARIIVGVVAVVLLAAGVAAVVRGSGRGTGGASPTSTAANGPGVNGPETVGPNTPTEPDGKAESGPRVPAPTAPLAQLTRSERGLAGPVLNSVERAAAVAGDPATEHPGLVVDAEAVARLVRARLTGAGYEQVRVLVKKGTNGGPETLRIEFKGSAAHTPNAARGVAGAHVLDTATFVTIVAD